MLAMLRHSSGLSRRLLEANLSLVRALGNAVAKRDSDTDAHNYRVTLYAIALAEALGLPATEIPDLVAGAFLHDVGKIGIPDQIVQKPGKLTREEFLIMKTHVLLGLDIVAGNAWLEGAARSFATTTSVSTERAIPTASRVRLFPATRGYSPSSTCSTP
ncbi:MAG: metal-dependent phosphohydrolase [Rhodocyclaceae bacterium]|nr:MAG: metal-dependent phosphohydrolase [Rhodocyclaceae bacterium]